MFRPSQDDIEKAKRDNKSWESAIGEDDAKRGGDDHKGLADKGKEWLAKKVGKA